MTKNKRFDKPFDRLTVLSRVGGLTILRTSKDNIQLSIQIIQSLSQPKSSPLIFSHNPKNQ